MLFYVSSFTQTMIVWFPDGTVKEWTEDKTLGELVSKKDREKMKTLYVGCECGESIVYFKFLTKEPLYVITTDSTCIEKCINDFDFYEYMRGPIVEIDIEGESEDNLLNYFYLQETLGSPDRKPKDSTGKDTYELWYYDRYNLAFKIYNGNVYGYKRQK